MKVKLLFVEVMKMSNFYPSAPRPFYCNVLEQTFWVNESGSSACDGSELADAVPTLDTKSLTVSHRTLSKKGKEEKKLAP